MTSYSLRLLRLIILPLKQFSLAIMLFQILSQLWEDIVPMMFQDTPLEVGPLVIEVEEVNATAWNLSREVNESYSVSTVPDAQKQK